jgi:glycerol-3-phosphate acyltransferase PlsY
MYLFNKILFDNTFKVLISLAINTFIDKGISSTPGALLVLIIVLTVLTTIASLVLIMLTKMPYFVYFNLAFDVLLYSAMIVFTYNVEIIINEPKFFMFIYLYLTMRLLFIVYKSTHKLFIRDESVSLV